MAEREPVRWITIKGKHLPVYEDGSIGVGQDYTPLYHGTTFKSMLAILESNELRGGVSNETETFGVSTTRNKDSAYNEVSLVLDKEKLHERYKIKPVYRESIFGKDLAEERLFKDIKNVSDYIRMIRWNDDSKSNIKLQLLRRRLVENFNNPNYTNVSSKFNDAYYIKKIAQVAKQRGIKLDKRMQEALSYIERFDRQEFDTERYNQMLEKQARKRRL